MTVMGGYRPALVFVFIISWCISAFAQDSAGVLKLEVKGNAAINQSEIAGARDKAVEEEANITVQIKKNQIVANLYKRRENNSDEI